MNKIHVFILIALLMSTVSYAQVFAQSSKPTLGLNTLRNHPNPFEEVTDIKFNLTEDCYVKLIVRDLQTERQFILVDGEISAGSQGVIFKAPGNSTGTPAKYKCILEVYSDRGSELKSSSEISMEQK